LIKTAIGRTFEAYFEHIDCSEIVAWFRDGGSIRLSDTDSTELCMSSFRHVNGLIAAAAHSGLAQESDEQMLVSVCELILEGLHAHKKISRSEERGYTAAKQEPREQGYDSFSRSRKVN
jgi:magnesium chelatase subunit I